MITDDEMKEIDAAILSEKTRAYKAEARVSELEAENKRLTDLESDSQTGDER